MMKSCRSCFPLVPKLHLGTPSLVTLIFHFGNGVRCVDAFCSAAQRSGNEHAR
jgi:hypothetical protein